MAMVCERLHCTTSFQVKGYIAALGKVMRTVRNLVLNIWSSEQTIFYCIVLLNGINKIDFDMNQHLNK